MTYKALILLISFLLFSCGGGGKKNTPPVLQAVTDKNITEGTVDSLLSFNATDQDGDILSYKISGVDASNFTLQSNQLFFRTSPDFEIPNDSNQDNKYELEILVSDSKAEVSDTFSITVRDAFEGFVLATNKSSQVFVDTNNNLVIDNGEISTRTNNEGKYFIEKFDVIDNTNLLIVALSDNTSNYSTDHLFSAPLYNDTENLNISIFSTFLSLSENDTGILEKITDKEFINIRNFISFNYMSDTNEDSLGLKLIQGQINNIMFSLDNLGNINNSSNQLIIEKLLDEIALNDINTLDYLTSNYELNFFTELLQDHYSNEFIDFISERIKIINQPWKISGTTIYQYPENFESSLNLNQNIHDYLNETISIADLENLTLPSVLFENLIDKIEGENTDSDSLVDLLDPDDDNDTFYDWVDSFPLDASEWIDTDVDGIGNNADTDDDNDTFTDENDAFPLDASEWIDTDVDGIGNNADTDDDNDGVNDERDNYPLDASLTPPTTNFTASTNSGFAPIKIFFNNNGSIPGNSENTITSYSWEIDGERVSSSDSYSHLFLDDGEFEIKLIIINDDNLTHSVAQTIVIEEVTTPVEIAGRIKILNNMLSDSDVNDSKNINSSNNNIANAQIISKDAVVSGFINKPNSGPDYDGEGLLINSGDEYDVYKISAEGGEIIKLLIADTSSDIDLELYNSSIELIDYSILPSGNEFETINVPAQDGEYYIAVKPYSGASNYNLLINEATSNSNISSSSFTSRDEIVSGDIVLEMFDSDIELPSKFSLQINKQYKTNKSSKINLVSINYESKIRFNKLTKNGYIQHLSNSKESISAVEKKYITHFYIKKLLQESEVKFAEPNFKINKASIVPNDTNYPLMWNLNNINLENAWDISTEAPDVTVAVLDTGIVQHPDIINNLTSDGYDFVSENSGDGDGYDSTPEDPGDGSDNTLCPSGSDQTSSFHGTHVAGTISAEGNNTLGITGVSWNTKLMDVRVLGCLGGSSFDIMQGILYASGLENASGILPNRKADIINMSLGGPSYSSLFQSVINQATEAGVIIVAAAGNDGNSNFNYPASYENVISVGSSTLSGNRAPYSQYNQKVDISAPGGNMSENLNNDDYPDGVLSTHAKIEDGVINYTYNFLQGTSMASPHIAGVIALMEHIHDFDYYKIEELIQSGTITTDLGAIGKDDEFGFGRIDAYKSLLMSSSLESGEPIPENPTPSASPNFINFSNFYTQAQFQIYNSGTGNLNVSNFVNNDPRLIITPPDSSNGLGVYVIELNKDNLEDGKYSSSITFTTNSETLPTLNVNVSYEVRTNIEKPNAGTLWINFYEVYKKQSNWIHLQINENGFYDFSNSQLAAGVYQVLAGTDPDNDGRIGNITEAIGYYPSKVDPIPLIINSNTNQVDFNINFQIPVIDTMNLNHNLSESITTCNLLQNKKTVYQHNKCTLSN